MAGLFFDGDLRRIYEVPTNPTLSVDGGGYRIYGDAGGSEAETRFTATELWSAWVNYHNANKWALLAFEKTGGAYRFDDAQGDPVYATFDLRFINEWAFVPANYPHDGPFIEGNVFPDNVTGLIFDSARITSPGVVPRILYADSLQTLRSDGAGSRGGACVCPDDLLIGMTDQQLVLADGARQHRHLHVAGDPVLRAVSRDPSIVLSENLTVRVCQ